jgi:hypothetical protein
MKDRTGKSSISMFNRARRLPRQVGQIRRARVRARRALRCTSRKTACSGRRIATATRFRKYRPNGELLLNLGEFGRWATTRRTINGPTAVVVQDNGNIVVADGYWNSRLVWFSPDGEYIKQIGSLGQRSGTVQTRPHALAQDSQGRLWSPICAAATTTTT